MSDQATFGGSFGGSADPTAGPVSVGGAPLPGAPQTPQQPGGGLFGSGLAVGGFGQPKYTPPAPDANPLDAAGDLLQQQIKVKTNAATNPIANFFDPEGAAAARAAVPQLTEQLQKIKTQKQQQTDIQAQARNFGVPASMQNPNMTGDTIDNYLLDQYKQGDPNAFKALTARGKTDWIKDYSGDFIQGQANNLSTANNAVTALNAAGDNQAAYKSALSSLNPKDRDALEKTLRQEGVQGGIPDTAAKWTAASAKHGAAFAQMRQFVDQHLRQYQNMTNFDQGMPKEAADSIAAGITLGSTSEPAFDGKNAKVRGQDGQPGVVGPNGSVRTDKFGLAPSQGGWNASSAERLEKSDKMFAGEDVKGAVNQYNIANKFRHEAFNEENYKSSAGIALLKDTLGGVGRDVAEKSAAAGTTGLSQMFGNQQGGIEGFLNRAQNELGAYQNWKAKGSKGPEPRISDETKKGLQAIAQANYDFAKEQGTGRLTGALRYAGQIGRPLEDIPLDKDLKAEVARYHEEGRIDAINGFNSYPSMVRGNQRIYFQQGSNVNGAQGPRAPMAFPQPGQDNPASPQAPGASGKPPAGLPPATPGPAGGPSPVTIAGQSVPFTPPPGASPAYLASMQRIESGNEKSPWTSGAGGLSSASGAFQMIDSTWAANKPPGAPARAKDATPAQQTAAIEKFTATNAASLKASGLPVNDTNLYVAHNLGPGGAAAILRADPNADARSVVGEAAAKNNPLFFKGRPTVATVLARYDNEMNKGGATGGNIADVARHSAHAAQQNPGAPASFWDRLTDRQPGQVAKVDGDGIQGDSIATPEQRANSPVVEHAPAVGSTIGSIGGAISPVPGGTMIGGGAGGAAGQAFKDWMQGRDQDPKAIAKQGALGAALGIAGPEAAPLVGAVARVGGVAGVNAGATALEGGDTHDVTVAALEGGAYALGGEALGKFVSMGGAQAFKALSRYTTAAQKELSASAGKLAEARSVLEIEQPKLPGIGDQAGAPNPKYEAAKKMEEAATQAIKDHGQNPDDMVHAYEQAKAGTSRGEAAVLRGATNEKGAVSQGYDDLRQGVRDTGVGAPKPNQPVPDGPVAQIRTAENPAGKVPEKFRPEAEHAEMLIKAPAKDWGEKWQQLQDAGTELIKKRLDFLAAGDKTSAGAMNDIFQGVRNQQKAAAEYVFGKEQGAKVIGQLESLDKRYAKVMNATGGLSYQNMSTTLATGNTPAARELEKNFREFAKGDPSAIRAFNAMKAGAKGDYKTEAALMAPIIMGEVSANLHGIPTMGAVSAIVGGHRIYKMVQGWMNAKLLGKAVTFKDFLAQEIGTGAPQSIAGVGQHGLVSAQQQQ